METTLYKVTFSDGRMFKIFCANRKQKERIYKTADAIKMHDANVKIEVIENGIHEIGQWERIVSALK